MASYKDYKKEMSQKRTRRTIVAGVLFALNVVLVCALAYVASRMLTGKPLFKVPAVNPMQGAADTQTTQIAGATLPTAMPGLALDVYTRENVARYWNTNDKTDATINLETLAFDSRMVALPANGKVSMEYFHDALFIGDSLAQGFGLYPPMSDYATCAGFKGVSIQYITQNAVGELPDKTSVPMWDYISAQTPGKIYLIVGTNSLVGQSDEALVKYYGDLLDALIAQFPGIPIYVQSIPPVTAATSASRPTLDNDRIRLINNSIALLAQQKGLYYLNVHEVLENEAGTLREDIAGKDGIHMASAQGYQIWTDYLQTHTAYNPRSLQYMEEPYNS